MPRQTETATELLARAESKEYEWDAHKEQDKERDARKHNDITKRNHERALRRYVFWQLAHIECENAKFGLPAPSEQEVRDQYLGPGTKLPDLATVKDFLRFYIYTS